MHRKRNENLTVSWKLLGTRCPTVRSILRSRWTQSFPKPVNSSNMWRLLLAEPGCCHRDGRSDQAVSRLQNRLQPHASGVWGLTTCRSLSSQYWTGSRLVINTKTRLGGIHNPKYNGHVSANIKFNSACYTAGRKIGSPKCTARFTTVIYLRLSSV